MPSELILHSSIGAPIVPMLVVSEQKRTYSNQDLRDWVRHWNALNTQEKTNRPINFRFPDTFPIRSPTLLRCAIVEPSLTPLLCMLAPTLSTYPPLLPTPY
jgi:hypothetical protein